MKIKLLHHTNLEVASTAIRKCWASEGKSDTKQMQEDIGWVMMKDMSEEDFVSTYGISSNEADEWEAGPKDKELIHRVGNKFKHASTLEHLNYSFDIDGISRACLQELARHRHASLSVKSTRYTLSELKNEEPFTEYHDDIDRAYQYIITTGNTDLDEINMKALEGVRQALQIIGNDFAKFSLPECYQTSLVWTINARSLQNFLSLRTSKSALWEIRKLANSIFLQLPEEHKYLFEEHING